MSIRDIWDYFEKFWDHPVTHIVIGGILTFLLVVILRRIIHSFFKRTSFIEEKKEKTIESMLNSLIKYIATFGFIVYVLGLFGIHAGNILAGAGVLGIIVGFGAQSLVKDLLAGMFLLYERQLEKGDWVKVNDTYEGLVEEIGLRFLKVRQWSGKLTTIGNGQIRTIENYNMEEMRVIENVSVSFYEDPKKIFALLEDTVERLNTELDAYLKKDLTGNPIEPFQLYGMSSLNDQFHGYQYTVTGLCNDLLYFTAAKETRRILAETMYENGIMMAEQQINYRNRPEDQHSS
ncbi:mechanosensitive ion channel family protein [Sediminibacillus halophilus]|uniref:Small-conductance mechanosensitive channel n=1 Tax=Sediminibacillus halophilus TaxID=482461 RepID=A0A1G9VE53_9BACI|nr:mechanosensitive ion channel family protein [Sediminibacillus halophilus]SDM70353.1 Small-conductance mechanosensitive channel [Sediminibacillus halophilus]